MRRQNSVTVTGTTATGNTVYVSATNTDENSATTIVPAAVDSGGAFCAVVPITGGTSVLNTVATSPSGATAHDQRAIVSDFIAGTQVLDVSDPSGDDNGPGTSAIRPPTASSRARSTSSASRCSTRELTS